MKQNKNNIYPLDVDKAWNILYSRLENDRLLPVEQEQSANRERKLSLQWIAVAAAVCIGIIFSVFHISQNRDNSLMVLQNKDKSGALVTTLNDGSVVYLAPNASISYPSVFTENQRKVELTGNALFCVAKNDKCPFVIETNEKIMIKVVGTIFAVQSSPGNPFELSVKEGKVNVQAGAGQENFSVEAGETARLTIGKLSKSVITNPRIFSYFTKKMCFKDEKLNNIVHAINTMYGSPTIVTDESINNRTLTVTFDNDSVETMTGLICMALNLEQINKQDTIYIRRISK